MNKVDVTAIINVHREGLLVASALQSIHKAVEIASANGLKVEVIALADRPDSLTLNILREYTSMPIDIKIGNNGDLADSRNEGISYAQGEFIAFLDGDDLWGPNWILSAVQAANSERRECIWHPEVNLYFSDELQWFFHHPDMDSEDFDIWNQLTTNCWTALSFAKRDVYIEYPYIPNRISDGTGYEDWSWNCTTIANGLIHKVVPNTCHFIRRKAFSMLQETSDNNALVSPHKLFDFLVSGRKSE